MCYYIRLRRERPVVFTPLPSPIPPRKTCVNPSKEQLHCALITRLPAEIRNNIYEYIFSLTPEESASASHHPLSVLLTCQRINCEATNLAFGSFTFPVVPNLCRSYVAVRRKTLHMAEHQIGAITSLSYDMGSNYPGRGGEVANCLTNALVLLPALKQFTVLIREGRRVAGDVHHTSDQIPNTHFNVVERYAPSWFERDFLQSITNNSTFAWQKGEKWDIMWPQQQSEYLSNVDDWFFSPDGTRFKRNGAYMGTEAIGNVRGVRECVCDCQQVTWTSADLVQETGRIVRVDVEYFVPPMYPKSRNTRISKS